MSYIRSRKESDHNTGRTHIYPYPPTHHLIDNAYHIERSLRLSTDITPSFRFLASLISFAIRGMYCMDLDGVDCDCEALCAATGRGVRGRFTQPRTHDVAGFRSG